MTHRTVTDQMGRSVRLAWPPRRIVSLVPSQTELLYALDAGDVVAGVTDFCTEPPDIPATVARVGGTKRFLFDRIEALAPDLVIGNREENYREGIERLAAAHPVWMSDIVTLEDSLAMIRGIGALVDRVSAADAMATEIAEGFATLPQLPRCRAAYLIWRKPWMAAGSGTFIHEVLQRAGFDNVFADLARYPECTVDSIRARQPEVLMLSSEPFPFGEEHVAELSAELPGVRVITVDAMPFSWYGSRLLEAPVYLRTLRQSLP